MIFLEEYLKKLNSHMDELLSKYKRIITFTSEEEIEEGLLKYHTPPKDTAFIFKFPDEQIQNFHTIGMKFPIKIYFFNKNKEIVFSYGEVSPGVERISSKRPAMYIVEIP